MNILTAVSRWFPNRGLGGGVVQVITDSLLRNDAWVLFFVLVLQMTCACKFKVSVSYFLEACRAALST